MQTHKTLYLLVVLFIIGGASLILSRRHIKSFETLKERLKKQQFSIVFFIITVLLYSPCALFLSNAYDMNISFWQFAPIALIPSLIGWVWGNIVLLGFDERLCNVALSICFSLTLCIYIQSNFLNFHMPILSGGDFDFSLYKSDTYISIFIWLFILILNAVLFLKMKNIYSKVTNVISALLSTMQLISLVALVTMNLLTQRTPVAISTAGQFELGTEENVVLFLLDSIEGHSMEQFFNRNPEYSEELTDFTFFTECMGGGAPTQLAMPIILTGSEYDGFEDSDEYFDHAWSDTDIYKKLQEKGYDIRFYSTPGSIRNVPLGVANNIISAPDIYFIGDKLKYVQKIYTLTALNCAPQLLKPYFMINTEEIEALLDIRGEDKIYLTEPRYYKKNFADAGGISISCEKSFRYYHLDGVHLPFQWDENLEYNPDATWEQSVRGHLDLVFDYIKDMKEKGVYDNSLIIIAGDHGLEADDSIRINPAVMIKRPNEHHDNIQINTAPIMLRNIYSTIASISTEEKNIWGPTVYDIDIHTQNQRTLHTVTDQMAGMFDTTGIEYEYGYVRVHPRNTMSRFKDATVWNPFEINKTYVDVDRGESYIEMLSQNGITESVAYLDEPTLSNEFTTCITFNQGIKNDIELTLHIGKVYGDEQRVKISCNGHRIDTILVRSEESKDGYTVVVPKEYINNNQMYIRLEMPMAVSPKMLDENSEDTNVYSMVLNGINVRVKDK